MGDPRCQCDTRLSAHPTPQCARFRPRLARRTAFKSSPRKSKHSAFAATLGLRRSKGKKNYKDRLWTLFSEYVRRKHADENGIVKCVTCENSAPWKEMDAGHYHPRTAGLATFFHEKNVHPQCTACNRFRHGNLTAYALFLESTYGFGILIELDALRRTTRKISEDEYLGLISMYQAKLKELP